jgi:hypothetical protein
VTDWLALGAYRKSDLSRFATPRELDPRFLLEWLKDRYDAPRDHTREELKAMMGTPVEERLAWLEGALDLTWRVKMKQWFPEIPFPAAPAGDNHDTGG